MKIKSVTVSIVFPSICHEVMVLDAMILVFWMLSFKSAFSLSSFTLILSNSLIPLCFVIRVASSAYLRLLIFLLAVLIPACVLFNLAFHKDGASGKRILLPMQETQEMWVSSLDQEDPLEKKMAIHSNILTWKIPWTEESGGLQSMGLQKVGHDWETKHNTHST